MHGSDSSAASMVGCTGSDYTVGTTVASTNYDGQVFALDVANIEKPWVSCYAVKDSTNACNFQVTGILYNPKVQPSTQSASTELGQMIAGKIVTTPTT